MVNTRMIHNIFVIKKHTQQARIKGENKVNAVKKHCARGKQLRCITKVSMNYPPEGTSIETKRETRKGASERERAGN